MTGDSKNTTGSASSSSRSAARTLSRLAGIVPSALSGSSTSSGSLASAPSVSSPPPLVSAGPTSAPTVAGTTSAPTTTNKAIDALEALASAADTGRPKISRGSQTHKSSSRERALHQQFASNNSGAAETSARNAGNSAFSAFGPSSSGVSGFSTLFENGSHFFGPGAFSFEADSALRSFSSSAASPSLFGSQQHAAVDTWTRDVQNTDGASSAPRHPHNDAFNPTWDSSPSSAGAMAGRNESALGGGKKPKDMSRAAKHVLQASSRDRGMVGLAKPSEGHSSRVAVAGRTCLKILQVPHGGRRRGRDTQAHPPSKQHSSIAYRRSRSRGVASGTRDDDAEHGDERDGIIEAVDVRTASRLGPAYLFSDVRWGYGSSAERIATSFTNGAVALWDLNISAQPIKVNHQIKYEHDRAVNRVVFGGQSGSWLMSGGQDGQMKLWDIRESRPASLVLKASSPVRHLSFSPSKAQPFTLLAACASGTLIRYDIRFTGRQGGGAIDRITGHVGSCLAMDWRDVFDGERVDTAGGNREGGWVVTSGVDKTIKIWDFSLATLSTKPVRTLYASQPVHAVAWHPSRPTEIASCALPLLSSDAAVDESWPPLTDKDSFAHQNNSWRNEIDIWDVRRSRFPRLSIKTDEPTAALLYNDEDTLWTVAKQSTTFHQHDVNSDSYALLDSIDRPEAVWTRAGDLVFIEDTKNSYRNFADPLAAANFREAADAETLKPEILLDSVRDLDPDFNNQSFAYLANNWIVADLPLDEMCRVNAEISAYADRPDCRQLWETLRVWTAGLTTSSATTVGGNDHTPHGDEGMVDKPPYVAAASTADRLRALHSLHERVGDGESSPNVRSFDQEANNGLSDGPSGSSNQLADDSPMSSGAVTPAIASGYGYYDSLSTPSSDSDLNDLRTRRSMMVERKSTRSSLRSGLTNQQSIAEDDAASSGKATSAEADSESDEDQDGDRRTKAFTSRARTAAKSGANLNVSHLPRISGLPRQASLAAPAPTPTRGFARGSLSHELGRGSVLQSDEASNESLERERARNTSSQLTALGLRENFIRDADACNAISDKILQILQAYADNLSATICCVLKNHNVRIPSLLVLRVTKAYLDQLRLAGLHSTAAYINKHCSPTSLRNLTENTVTWHTSCGRCGKAMEQSPFGYCHRCRSLPTMCCICHQLVRAMLTWCSGCGHGGHAECLAVFASLLAPPTPGDGQHSTFTSIADVSHPSTPGIATPLRRWMWGFEDEDDGASYHTNLEEHHRSDPALSTLQTVDIGPYHAVAPDSRVGIGGYAHEDQQEAARGYGAFSRQEHALRPEGLEQPAFWNDGSMTTASLYDAEHYNSSDSFCRATRADSWMLSPPAKETLPSHDVAASGSSQALAYNTAIGDAGRLDPFASGAVIHTTMQRQDSSGRSTSDSDPRTTSQTPDLSAGTVEKARPLITPFISKLARLLDDPTTDHLIRWTNDGTSFTFAHKSSQLLELFSKLFRHNKLASFVRQLNIYGFIRLQPKDVHHACLNSPPSIETEFSGFWHPLFFRSSPQRTCDMTAIKPRNSKQGQNQQARRRQSDVALPSSGAGAWNSAASQANQLLVTPSGMPAPATSWQGAELSSAGHGVGMHEDWGPRSRQWSWNLEHGANDHVGNSQAIASAPVAFQERHDEHQWFNQGGNLALSHLHGEREQLHWQQQQQQTLSSSLPQYEWDHQQQQMHAHHRSTYHQPYPLVRRGQSYQG
ncbi:SEA (Seh1-associated) complex subunit [Microbotryomycetes sp. JL221]|nr:SEA (Seh1-associated) complex subunit [Microbotryomycetes sp. JL221]